MKKALVIVLSLAMVMTTLVGCGKEEKVKTGLAVVTSADHSSKDAGEKDGLAQADSTVAAVLVNKKGVIVDAVVDVVQTKVNFNTSGEITTDLAKTFVSKYELGEANDMRKASPIGKEWYEQAEAFEKYVIGKTLEEVKGIALEDGYATSTDLTASVTMSIADLVAAVEKAYNNAEELGATAKDKVGLGLISSIAKSKNAGEKDGLAQAYATYAAVSVDGKGKMTSVIVEASQTNINFDGTGKIVDLASEFKTKTELGDAYDMKKASPIGKEWFEQAEAFAKYATGKTVAEVSGMALTEGTPNDLTSSVTITVTDMITSIEKAVARAK